MKALPGGEPVINEQGGVSAVYNGTERYWPLPVAGDEQRDDIK